jgi:uncharacterized RDD family membrane protein YckC
MRPTQGKTARRKGSPYPKAELLPRLVAKSIDFVVAYLLAWIVPGIGPLAGMAYLMAADAIHEGQSIGKRLMGIKTVHVPSRRPCSLVQSAIRNLPPAIAFALTLNPVLALVAGPLLAFEAYMAFSDALGIRIGDIFADTQVIDGKVPVDAPIAMDSMIRKKATAIPGGDVGEAAEARTSG